MKGKSLLGLLIIVALISLFVGCSQKGISIEGRIYEFINDLNNTDRSYVYENFHPDIPMYDDIKADGWWDFPFEEASIQYSISGLNAGDPNVVTAIINDGAGTGWGPQNALFKMLLYGNDWMIEELTLGATDWVF